MQIIELNDIIFIIPNDLEFKINHIGINYNRF